MLGRRNNVPSPSGTLSPWLRSQDAGWPVRRRWLRGEENWGGVRAWEDGLFGSELGVEERGLGRDRAVSQAKKGREDAQAEGMTSTKALGCKCTYRRGVRGSVKEMMSNSDSVGPGGRGGEGIGSRGKGIHGPSKQTGLDHCKTAP